MTFIHFSEWDPHRIAATFRRLARLVCEESINHLRLRMPAFRVHQLHEISCAIERAALQAQAIADGNLRVCPGDCGNGEAIERSIDSIEVRQ